MNAKQGNNMKSVKIIMIALIAMSLCSCANISNAGKGAMAGAAIGSATGSMVGNSKTTIIGAGAGTLIGGFVGFFMDQNENDKEMIAVQKERNCQNSTESEFVELERQKVVTYKEKVAVQNETRKFYIDPKTKRKVYVKSK